MKTIENTIRGANDLDLDRMTKDPWPYVTREAAKAEQRRRAVKTTTIRTDIILTGRFNKVGDELVIFPGISDFGSHGYFVGSRHIDRRTPGETRVSLYTKTFFVGNGQSAAIADLESGYYAEFK